MSIQEMLILGLGPFALGKSGSRESGADQRCKDQYCDCSTLHIFTSIIRIEIRRSQSLTFRHHSLSKVYRRTIGYRGQHDPYQVWDLSVISLAPHIADHELRMNSRGQAC
jgi:hypothetical protein